MGQEKEGLVYVVYNTAIVNPCTGEPYMKIGETSKTVSERFHGLDLKMPGKWEVVLAFEFEDRKAIETRIHREMRLLRDKGEFFRLGRDDLDDIETLFYAWGGTERDISGLQHVEKGRGLSPRNSNPEIIGKGKPITFRMLGKHRGMRLHFISDESKTCETVRETIVRYNNKKYELRDLAEKLSRDMGLKRNITNPYIFFRAEGTGKTLWDEIVIRERYGGWER